MIAKEKQSEDGLSKALSSMDRVAAVELAHRQYLCPSYVYIVKLTCLISLFYNISEYNQFKEELGDWLGSFKGDKVVKVEDVQEFFSGMQARKRARMDDGIPPSFCR